MLPSHRGEKTGSADSSYGERFVSALGGAAVVGASVYLFGDKIGLFSGSDIAHTHGSHEGSQAGQERPCRTMGNTSATLVAAPNHVNSTTTNQTHTELEGEKSKTWDLERAGKYAVQESDDNSSDSNYEKRAFVNDPTAESLNGKVNVDGIPRKYKVDTDSVPSEMLGGAKTNGDESGAAETAESLGGEGDRAEGGRFGNHVDILSK